MDKDNKYKKIFSKKFKLLYDSKRKNSNRYYKWFRYK